MESQDVFFTAYVMDYDGEFCWEVAENDHAVVAIGLSTSERRANRMMKTALRKAYASVLHADH